jgi:DNA-binding transcriptional LysR family regulator
MELSDLRSFVAVAEELHFGRAAERLHVTQPPLSRQIRRLEDELGARLFHRTTRRVDLTDAGSAFLAEARQVLAAAEKAVSRARSVHRGETGRLAIGAVTPAIDGFLPDLVREFRKRHPRIDVSLTEMDTTSQLAALRAERLHAGFVRLADHDVRGLSTQVVRRERLVLALPRRHRLAGADPVSLASLAGEPVVALAPEVQPELHRRLAAACSDAGFALRVTQTTRTVPTMTALVAAGMGVAFVPESARSTRRTGVEWRAIRGRLPDVEISVAWRSWNASPALGHLRDLLRARGVAVRG